MCDICIFDIGLDKTATQESVFHADYGRRLIKSRVLVSASHSVTITNIMTDLQKYFELWKDGLIERLKCYT